MWTPGIGGSCNPTMAGGGADPAPGQSACNCGAVSCGKSLFANVVRPTHQIGPLRKITTMSYVYDYQLTAVIHYEPRLTPLANRLRIWEGVIEMAVLSNTMWRANPGKGQQLFEAASSARTIHERHGAKCFMVQWSSAGSFTGTFGYGMLFSDLVAWGRFNDSIAGDADWQNWMQKYYIPAETPATLLTQATATDLPGFEAPDAAEVGTFVLAINGKLAAGRTVAEVTQLACEVKPVALELGARWMRFRRVGAGGEATGAFAATFGFQNAEQYAQWQARYSSDPRGILFTERSFGPSSPFSDLTMSVGRVVPI